MSLGPVGRSASAIPGLQPSTTTGVKSQTPAAGVQAEAPAAGPASGATDFDRWLQDRWDGTGLSIPRDVQDNLLQQDVKRPSSTRPTAGLITPPGSELPDAASETAEKILEAKRASSSQPTVQQAENDALPSEYHERFDRTG